MRAWTGKRSTMPLVCGCAGLIRRWSMACSAQRQSTGWRPVGSRSPVAQKRSVNALPLSVSTVRPPVPQSGLQQIDIAQTSRLGLGLCSGQHPRLEIQGENTPGRSDATREGDGQSSRSTSRIEHSHSRHQAQRLNNLSSAIHPRERIIKLDQPTQPHRAGQTLALGGQAPAKNPECG